MQTPHIRISRTSEIPNPTYYIKAIDGEFRDWAFSEERAPGFRGHWRETVFRQGPDHPLDLEIGTGNGYFFAHQARQAEERALVGIELKFKPLIQSIRRALRGGSTNARIVRYDARYPEDLFAEGELNNVFIHHPDPWEKRKQNKNRLIQRPFLEKLFRLQRSGTWVEFKTDSRDYFDWALREIEGGPYALSDVTYDLHNSEFASRNFVTHFESIFLRQGLPIHYALLRRP